MHRITGFEANTDTHLMQQAVKALDIQICRHAFQCHGNISCHHTFLHLRTYPVRFGKKLRDIFADLYTPEFKPRSGMQVLIPCSHGSNSKPPYLISNTYHSNNTLLPLLVLCRYSPRRAICSSSVSLSSRTSGMMPSW